MTGFCPYKKGSLKESVCHYDGYCSECPHNTEGEEQMHDKLKELSIKMARGTGKNGMAMQLMVVDDVTEGESETKDDTISRQAAIELAMQYCPDDDGSCSKEDYLL